MSRINEVLRRARSGPAPPRPSETSLNEYPAEHPSSSEGKDLTAEGPLASEEDGRAQPYEHDQSSSVRVRTSKGRWTFHTRRLPSTAGRSEGLAAEVSPALRERYRKLATTLHDSQIQRGLKTLMVSSARPQEGKTSVALNLARTFGESYANRILLIDADLQRPAVHAVLGVENDIGLSDGLNARGGAISMVEVSPFLDVLLAGRPGSNTADELTSDNMRSLLEECAIQFDWVLLDAPAVTLISDARTLARMIHAVVFVMSGSTPFPVVEKAMTDLGRDRIVGTVLTGLDEGVLRTGAPDGRKIRE
jgi:protein-tyrosine kinase